MTGRGLIPLCAKHNLVLGEEERMERCKDGREGGKEER